MSAEGYKYYVLYNGNQVLARVRGLFKAEVFHDTEQSHGWKQADHVARQVTGIGGDSDFDEITEAAARQRFLKAF